MLVFAKTPIVGKVKTRLIPKYGADKALQFYLMMFERLMNESIKSAVSIEIWCAPTVKHAIFEKWQKKNQVSLWQQKGADLGERMAYAVDHRLVAAEKVLVVGCDCPEITASLLQRAFKLLDSYDVVIQPAEDGGYVMIGMNHYYAELFEDIRWGSKWVYTETKKKLDKLGVSWVALEMSWDIDHPEDVERWMKIKK